MRRPVSLRRRGDPDPVLPGVISQPCTFDQMRTLDYAIWAERIGQRPILHRRQWEWIYILQALRERGVVGEGRCGVRGGGDDDGPVASYLSARGCEVVEGDADFLWSCGSMAHVGSIEAGLAFVIDSLPLVRPGGVVVHTTELNVSSLRRTLDVGETVLFRRDDLAALEQRLVVEGHDVRCSFALGDSPADRHVDGAPPTAVHLRTWVGGYAATSYGLVIRRRASS